MVNIPNQYIPFQITKGVHYSEIKSSAPFQHQILSYWRIENRSAHVHLYPILPDGTVDLLSDLYGDRQLRVTTSQEAHMSLPLPPHSTAWGIRFFPSAFSSIFKIPMSAIQGNNWLDINELRLSPELRFLHEQLNAHYDIGDKKRIFEQFLEKFLHHKGLKTDNRFLNVLEEIYTSNGNLRIEKALHHGISPRQLRRVFDEYIGFSPKVFSKIIQLQHAVQRITRPDYSYFDSGFYDQAHFIREMKTFCGLSPAKLKSVLIG